MLSTKIIAEIGINHNGDIELCKRMMEEAKKAGCGFVKIQKRNPDKCVPEAQKSKPKLTPWGNMTYLEYKYKIEFDEKQIEELKDYSRQIGINFFASVWDLDSCDIMCKYTKIGKIPSALITNLELCKYARKKFDCLIISTGMSTEEEIEDCINCCKPDIVMHTNSTYPCPPKELNLRYITYLQNKYPNITIGYSGHESGVVCSLCAVSLGAKWIERHITLDRSMWGSDQSSSIEPHELKQLVDGIREIDLATQYEPQPRILFEAENIKKKSLRG